MARDAIHYIRSADTDVTSVSQCPCSIIGSWRCGPNGADAGGNVVALSHVVTTWTPREILCIGRAIFQDVRAALETSSTSDCRIMCAEDTANIEPLHYDLIWAQDRFDLVDDAGAACALRQIRDGLTAGGRLVVPLGPDVGVPSPDTDLFDKWFCFHRTGVELAGLLVAAGFAENQVAIRKDPASGDLTLIASKDADC